MVQNIIYPTLNSYIENFKTKKELLLITSIHERIYTEWNHQSKIYIQHKGPIDYAKSHFNI